jgi:hypothetical protein
MNIIVVVELFKLTDGLEKLKLPDLIDFSTRIVWYLNMPAQYFDNLIIINKNGVSRQEAQRKDWKMEGDDGFWALQR